MTLHSWWMAEKEGRRLWHMLNREEIKDYQVELRK